MAINVTLHQVGEKYRLKTEEGGFLRQMGPRKLSKERADYRISVLNPAAPVDPKFTVVYKHAGDEEIIASVEFSEGDHITFPDVGMGGAEEWHCQTDGYTEYTYFHQVSTWHPEELLMPAQNLEFTWNLDL